MGTIFKNDVPYGGTVEDPYIRYNTVTGKVQIKDAEGVWHNLMDGGLNMLDLNGIAKEDWVLLQYDSLLTSYSVETGPLTVTAYKKDNVDYQLGVRYVSQDSFELSGFRYLYIAGSATNQGPGKTYKQDIPRGYIGVLNVDTGEETTIKTFNQGNSTFDENISIGMYKGNYKIVVASSTRAPGTGVVTLNSFKFSANPV